MTMTDTTPATPSPVQSTRDRIAAGLDRGFADHGFAGRSVDELRTWSGVSLRTLYKYFPSRESMVLGALEYRDRSYSNWIAGGPDAADDPVGHVLHPLVRLNDWLSAMANIGDFFLNARSEYPDSTAVAAAVTGHKGRVTDEFARRLRTVAPDRDTTCLVDTLFLLHEGITQTARLQGVPKAAATGMYAARTALAAEGIGEHR